MMLERPCRAVFAHIREALEILETEVASNEVDSDRLYALLEVADPIASAMDSREAGRAFVPRPRFDPQTLARLALPRGSVSEVRS